MRPRQLVVQSRPRYQRSVPSPFARQRGGSFVNMFRSFLGVNWLLRQAKKRRTQRGGWISASVPKPPGYYLTKWLLARQRRARAQRGGWMSASLPQLPGVDLAKWGAVRKRIKRRRR